MKKTTLFVTLSAIILGVAAFIVTKANSRKFTGFSTAVNSMGSIKIIGANIFTTVAAHGSLVYIVTSGDTQEWYFFTKTNRVKAAYLK